jgi:hypothetical protein
MFTKNHIPHNFKTNGVGYQSLHQWVAYHKPKSMFCECCGKVTEKLDASSINHTYERDISKWEWLCRPCHGQKDKESGVRKHQKECIRGHKLEGNNIWLDNRGGRVCKMCKSLRAKRDYSKNRIKIIERVTNYRKKKRSTIKR